MLKQLTKRTVALALIIALALSLVTVAPLTANAAGTHEITTVDIHNLATKKLDSGQGEIKYIVNGGNTIALNAAGATSKKLTFTAGEPYTPKDGWYRIHYGEAAGQIGLNTHVGVDKNGNASIKEYATIQFFQVQSVGNNQITIKTVDGKYLGLPGNATEGTQVKLVDTPYAWNAYQTTEGKFTLRPPANTDLAFSVSPLVSDNSADGYQDLDIILASASSSMQNSTLFSWTSPGDEGWETLSTPPENLKQYDKVFLLYGVMERINPGSDFTWGNSWPKLNSRYSGQPKIIGDDYIYYAGQIFNLLGGWGVYDYDVWNTRAEVTYGDLTNCLIKLMAYNKKVFSDIGYTRGFQKPRGTFTLDIIKKFGLKNLSANSKVTYLQAFLLCDATVQWYYAGATKEEFIGSLGFEDWDFSNDYDGYPYPYPYAYLDTMSSLPKKPTGITAKPTDTKFMLNGAEVALPAYEIGGNNYVKLRDVGALLKTRFDVRWEDNKAKLIPFAVYTAIGGELATIGTQSKTAAVSATEFAMYDKWGEWVGNVTPTAYGIGGNNFIKLRDIAKLFDFDVDWRDGKAWIEPDVSPYTED